MTINSTLGPNGYTVSIPAPVSRGGIAGAGRARIAIVGDSLALAYRSRPTTVSAQVNQESSFAWFNALAGDCFDVILVSASGGKTSVEIAADYLPAALAADVDYVDISQGVNDLYVAFATADVTYAQIVNNLGAIVAAGKVPIWSTVLARSWISGAIQSEHLKLNDMLRQYAQSSGVGLFWDGFRYSVDPASTTIAMRSGWSYDGVHQHNVGAYWLGKAKYNALKRRLPLRSSAHGGYENAALIGASGRQILTNPAMTGTGGTAGSNVVGTVPTGWTVDWATRTGTGIATASIVDIADPDSGLVTAKAIQVAVTAGVTAASDVLRITQAAGLTTYMAGGKLMESSCVLELSSPAGTNRLAQRVQANSNETTWWGGQQQATHGEYPEATGPLYTQTEAELITGVGAPSAARFDVRLSFTGASSAVMRCYMPRVRVTSDGTEV